MAEDIIHKNVESVFIKEGEEFNEYCTLESFATKHNMSRQSIYLRCKYGAPESLKAIKLRNIFLVLVNQEVNGDKEIPIETTDPQPA